MARRRKQPFFIDLIDASSKVHWSVGLFLAILSYLGFHFIAGIPVSTPTNAQESATALPLIALRVAANVAQYALPVAFLIGSIASVFRRKKRVNILRAATDIEAVRDLSWKDFELLIGQAYRRQGYFVSETGGNEPDGGVDLVLRKEGKKVVVQCKRWKNFTVSVMPVRELYGVMTAEGADSCIFVSSGTFSRDALEFAQGKPILLLDGQHLMRLLKTVQYGAPVSNSAPIRSSSSVKGCPKCGKPMIRRMAKRGANAGQEFWGCSDYPRCRGTA